MVNDIRLGGDVLKTYIVALDDLFRIEAESEEEAKEKTLERIGEDGWIPRNAHVVEKI